MDFENELACVVFDEIHYINDLDRGKVWEETIMMLPRHIQMVMLSATLDSPEKFALWCETRGTTTADSSNTDNTNTDNTNTDKIVYLTTTYERVVPLTHYTFITCAQGIFKVLKDKVLEADIKKTINTLHVLQDAKGVFNDSNYQKIKKTLALFDNKNHIVKRQHVLNSVTKYMVENTMLPAICFVLSRKMLEQCAKEVTTVLLEDDSKVPYIVRRECEQIIRKLPNYQEYLNLPEYINMVSLLEKGVAIHHAGIMPILREMVELLFSKGYVKLLFATETFAVGINMPTKTVLFTDLNKFDGNTLRPLYSHEYTQMAGRAGRRGIDTIGNVIHLTNIFKEIDSVTFKTIMKGKPQTLTSKFKISYNLLLNLIDIGETDYVKYVKRSMIQNDIEKEMGTYYSQMSNIQNELDNMSLDLEKCRTPIEDIQEYIEQQKVRTNSVNKTRKAAEKAIETLINKYPTLENDVKIVSKYNKKRDELNIINDNLVKTEVILDKNIQTVLQMLRVSGFIEYDNNNNNNNSNKLTIKGQIACQLREVHCLIFAEFLEQGKFKKFEAKELVGILSCFTNISVAEDKRAVGPVSKYKGIQECITEIYELYVKQSNLEVTNKINTGYNYDVHFDLIDYVIEWCECETDIQCKELLNRMNLEKEIFLGEFVKALLKINNITAEMERISETIGDIDLLATLRKVPELTLKYVATNQSLYV
jgi:superfamily II RNA helicase